MSSQTIGLICFLITTLFFLAIALWESYELLQTRQERDRLKEILRQNHIDY